MNVEGDKWRALRKTKWPKDIVRVLETMKCGAGACGCGMERQAAQCRRACGGEGTARREGGGESGQADQVPVHMPDCVWRCRERGWQEWGQEGVKVRGL